MKRTKISMAVAGAVLMGASAGSQAVTWQAQGIQRFEIFTLKWTW